MGVAHALTIAAGLRYGTYRYLADDLQVRGADVEADYALLQRISLRGTLAGETASYSGDGRTPWDGYEAFALAGVRFDAIAHDSTLPVRPYLALGIGLGVRHQTYDGTTIPPERTTVAPYLQLAQVGLDLYSDDWLVRGSLGFEGLATSAPPVWAIVLAAGHRF
ncbi:MAG TPA: hypothetical protein VLT45_21330 [Kofleriaceae bacterium]|nr:hypothetical protein [Kofleriaceae bacterium]